MQNNHDEDQAATVERVYGMKDELGRWRYVGRTKLQKEHRKRLHQTHLQCDPLSSPLYRYMHENGLSFDDWTIHELAVVAFPDTDCGAQLETAMIRHLRAPMDWVGVPAALQYFIRQSQKRARCSPAQPLSRGSMQSQSHSIVRCVGCTWRRLRNLRLSRITCRSIYYCRNLWYGIE